MTTLTELSEIIEVLERHAFASLVGNIGAVTFRDFERGDETYGFVRGVPVPMSRLMGVITGQLFAMPSASGLNLHGTDLPLDPILRVWSKMKLPAPIDESLRNGYEGLATNLIIEEQVHLALVAYCHDAKTDDGRREMIGSFIDRHEMALFESRREAISTIGLKRLHAAPLDVYEWGKLQITMKYNYDNVF